MKIYISTICFFLVIIFGIFGSRALFHRGFYTSHDGEHQLVRQYVFDQGLRDGQIPVRYSRQLFNGYGYPLFMFTYRLPFYFGEVFRLVGFSFVDSVKSVFLLTYLLSGVSMYWFLRRWGNAGATVGSILYLWAPYRFSVLFVRAALGEHVALVFFPLIFLAMDSKRDSRTARIIGPIAIFGLILSHLMITQIAVLATGIWVVSQLLLSTDRRAYIFRVAEVTMLGLLLSAYYLIPAVWYKSSTVQLSPQYYTDHFVTFRQLLYSPWGYGFSMPGTKEDGMSFQLGIAQWVSIGFGIIVLVSYFVRKRKKATPIPISKSRLVIEAIALLSIVTISLFLMLDRSKQIWKFWESYLNIDFPWRFLSIATFSSAALFGLGVSFISRRIIRTFTIVGVLSIALYANRNHLRVNKYIDYPDSKLWEYDGTSNSDNEYRPKWDDAGVATRKQPEVIISDGSGKISVTESRSNKIVFALRSYDKVRVDVNTLYFPGWKIFLDGQPWPFKYSGEGGIMRIDVPVGDHIVGVEYMETTLSKFANGMTLLVLVELGRRVRRVWQ